MLLHCRYTITSVQPDMRVESFPSLAKVRGSNNAETRDDIERCEKEQAGSRRRREREERGERVGGRRG